MYLLLLLAVTASSVWHVLGKVALTQGMDASAFLVYRLLLTSCVLIFGGQYVLRIPFDWPRPELRARLVFIGVTTFTHSLFFLYGLRFTTPFMCAVMQPAVPVLVWLMSVISGSERSNLRKAFGVALCSFGAVGAAASSSHNAESQSAEAGTNFKIGIVLLVLQCCFYAIHLVFQQPLLRAIPPVHVTGMVYGVAGLTMLTATFLQTWTARVLLPVIAPEKVASFPVPNWALSQERTAWLALGFCVLFASAFTHGIYSWATKRLANASTVSVFITVEPLTTTLVSLLIMKCGLPSATEGACAGIVALGVMLVLLGGSNHPHSEEYEMIAKVGEEFDIETEQTEKEMYPTIKRGSTGNSGADIQGEVPVYRM